MYLVEDMIMSILLRLPVRCLMRFKCVCKTWYALIESPSFVDMHLSLQLTKGDEHIQTLRCTNPSDLYSWKNLLTRFDDDLESHNFLASPNVELPNYSDENSPLAQFCNHLPGIVCISTFFPDKIILWNPALREFRTLPPRFFHNLRNQVKGCCAMTIGLGFDYTTNDYKVLHLEIFSKDDPITYVVQVYNIKSNTWRILEGIDKSVLNHLCKCNRPIFFKGCFHWLVGDSSKPFILTFNIATELFGDIHCPHASVQDNTFEANVFGLSFLFISDKSTISLVSDFQNHRTSRELDVWMMKDYGSSWTKQYSIDFSNIERIWSSWKNDQLICSTYDHDLICCDLPTGQQHRVREYINDHEDCTPTLDVVVCVETLVSVGLRV